MIRKGSSSFLATCLDCDWETGDYKNGVRKASEHHMRTGHRIEGEKQTWYRWGR